MSSDDLTHNLNSDEGDNTTQPTITAVFRLLRDVQDGQKSLSSRFDALESSVNSRFDGFNSRFDSLESSVNSRFDSLESRLTRDFAGVDARFAEMSDEMKNGLLRLSDKLCDRIDRSRLHSEADYEDLLRRMRKLESKAS